MGLTRGTLLAGAAALALSGGAASAKIAGACGANDKYVIGFSQANNAEPYRQHVNDDLTAAAAKVPQFTLQIADGAGNVNTQTSQMDNFITQKVDLILISPFEAAPLTPVVQRAMKAGIPVIELDRKTVGDPGKDCCWGNFYKDVWKHSGTEIRNGKPVGRGRSERTIRRIVDEVRLAKLGPNVLMFGHDVQMTKQSD